VRAVRGRGRTGAAMSARIAAFFLVAVATAAGAEAEGPVRRVAQPIRDEYVVVLKDGVAACGTARAAGVTVASVAADLALAHGAAVERVFEHALRGFAARMTAAQAAVLAADPRVDYVEEDGAVRLETTQTSATWGIDRIDQRSLPLSTTFSYTNTGLGVTAYVIDTGIPFTHSEFGGRAVSGFDAVDGGSADDCNGHGTHVAGTVGGATYGVAKGVTLVAVRVLGCLGAGSNAKVIAGIDWVTGDHAAAGTPAVANMSLGSTSTSGPMDAAVRNSIAGGVTYALAAGNGNLIGIPQDACTTSPARVTEAMTISATNKNDKKPFWANFGDCVDWFAPGVGITSAWKTSDTATARLTGTSMAAPHTTGSPPCTCSRTRARLPRRCARPFTRRRPRESSAPRRPPTTTCSSRTTDAAFPAPQCGSLVVPRRHVARGSLTPKRPTSPRQSRRRIRLIQVCLSQESRWRVTDRNSQAELSPAFGTASRCIASDMNGSREFGYHCLYGPVHLLVRRTNREWRA